MRIPQSLLQSWREVEDLVWRLARLLLFALLAGLFLGGLYGMVVLWFELMNPYG